MKEVSAKVQMYVGVSGDGKGFTQMGYNPYEHTVIFRDHSGAELRLAPDCMRRMVSELTDFVALLERIGVKTK